MTINLDPQHLTPASSAPSVDLCHALSVDVEDYFQVSAFEGRVSRKTWETYECRVEANTDRMLSLFDQCQVRGTFFILGWVAERYPGLVSRIAQSGHEIASHGYWHRLVYDLTPEQFASDIADSVEAIHNACGIRATAYRAPSFSIVERSLWALDILAEQGFTTDSSIFPISGHDRYGMPGAKKEIHTLPTAHGDLVEFPPTASKIGGLTVPIGGGYFRLFPRQLTSAAITQHERLNRPAMFYIHPWEIDPHQPRIQGAGAKSRFRHYVGLARTEQKLRRLLQTHRFATMEEAIGR
ncbi:XrtA system polysaccharide deacetylase [Allorhodopirellula solitaria]|uniref:Peptidoglycan deacetylase n=1 Tax=Allorhodopirellula solitaria TaxID=2527987 RepID=A0A5C5WZ98_9BACT|nr:XrtA system polysaccharide deacetylase [Allorhodopirellula solitaria]TWT55870.1 Peptidoglycan deacetylase [Allorhodopirellula solitaria]